MATDELELLLDVMLLEELLLEIDDELDELLLILLDELLIVDDDRLDELRVELLDDELRLLVARALEVDDELELDGTMVPVELDDELDIDELESATELELDELRVEEEMLDTDELDSTDVALLDDLYELLLSELDWLMLADELELVADEILLLEAVVSSRLSSDVIQPVRVNSSSVVMRVVFSMLA